MVLIARKELTEFRKEEFSNSKVYVLYDEGWTAQNLRRALATVRGALFFDTHSKLDDLSKVIQVALARVKEREKHAQMMQVMRQQNRQIEELNHGLELVVRDRTLNELESRRASQKNISRVRDIIGFIKDLSQAFDIADILPLVRRHVKEHHLLDSPILFIPRGEMFGDIYYMRSSEVLHHRHRGEWTISARIQTNETDDSRFLANALGRPVGKVLRFPLITARYQKDPSRAPLLMFEHRLSLAQLDDLVEALTEKLQPVSWAVDRLVLEQELKRASRDWEMTFDELSEPIAILDHDGSVLRSNSHWSDEFSRALKQPSKNIRFGDKLFTVERYPIRMSADAPPLSWVVYLRDETRSRRLKSQVVQVEKMSAIGQLAGHIAHELNNPLTGIRSLAQVLLTETGEQTQVHKDLDEVEQAAGRCQSIINNLLEFSRGGLDSRVTVTDLNEIVRKTLPLLKSELGKRRADVELVESDLRVRVEPHLIQQVIFNLVNNACQALPEKGEIHVRSGRSGEWAFIEVEDNGPGIASELQARIFEPFFTTKAEGEGTGLGLSLSRDFVRQFGGEIECTSEVGRGSVFRVRLPLEP